MQHKFKLHDKVIKTRGDYTFKGAVISVLEKVKNPDAEIMEPSGQVRYAVQNAAGMVHIFHENQLDFDPGEQSEFEIAVIGLKQISEYEFPSDYDAGSGMVEIANRTLKQIGFSCKDEGCPHYGTPHGHPGE